MNVVDQVVRFLLVEDSEDDAFLLERELAGLGAAIEVRRVETAGRLAAALAEKPWDVVLSDFRLPAFSGMAALRQVRDFDAHLPFILVSGRIGEEAAADAMRAGANDYVMKGNMARLCPAIERELREAAMRRDKQAAEARITRLEHYDAVTGLANRALFEERLAAAGEWALHRDAIAAIVVVGIDGFEAMTATHDRDSMRQLMREIAARIAGRLGPDRLARVGDDRFGMLLPPARNAREAARSIEAMMSQAFGSPFVAGRGDVTLSARAGIALCPGDGDAPALLRNAEAALARARAGHESCVFHDAAISAALAERLDLEARLRRAVAREEFELWYQPQVCLGNMEIASLEALLRWAPKDAAPVMPAQFVPLLEDTGLIVEVGAWVLRRALADQRRWQAQGLAVPRVAVNVSTAQLVRRDFVPMVKAALEGGRHGGAIDLEITESMLMGDVRDCVQKLNALRALGLRIAIDDFGVGYSSLAYLARLPAQALKIDRTFVESMLVEPHARTVVATVIQMARQLRLEVVAEGIENRAQLDALRKLGCRYGQGFLLGRPASYEDTTAVLRSGYPRGGLRLAM